MVFNIRQNDSRPKVIATLFARYNKGYPPNERIIYSAGDTVVLYIQKNNVWVSRPVSVDTVMNGGESILVSVVLEASDVDTVGQYSCYFRNETKELTVPTLENFTIRVIESGH